VNRRRRVPPGARLTNAAGGLRPGMSEARPTRAHRRSPEPHRAHARLLGPNDDRSRAALPGHVPTAYSQRACRELARQVDPDLEEAVYCRVPRTPPTRPRPRCAWRPRSARTWSACPPCSRPSPPCTPGRGAGGVAGHQPGRRAGPRAPGPRRRAGGAGRVRPIAWAPSSPTSWASSDGPPFRTRQWSRRSSSGPGLGGRRSRPRDPRRARRPRSRRGRGGRRRWRSDLGDRFAADLDFGTAGLRGASAPARTA
jgi:hypothetical protein